LTETQGSVGRPLRLEDAGLISGPLARIAADLSESVFANLYLFRHVHGYRLVEASLPHITGRTYDGADIVIPLFDVETTDPVAVRRLLGPDGWLYPLAENPAERLSDRYETRWNDDDSDYVYAAERMRSFAGLKVRRQQLRKFEALGPVSVHRIETVSDDAEAKVILGQWQADVAKPWAATDYAACAEAIEARAALGLFGLVTEVSGEPAGFVLASAISPQMAVIHFAKGLRRYDGVFPFMFRAFAREFSQFDWLNFEQDLGNPRFRQAKRSYRPARMGRKFRLRPRL
jgi:hypothetical protein